MTKIRWLINNYTRTHEKWIEYGDYFNYPESMESKVRRRKLCFEIVPCFNI